ncbi:MULTISPECIES: hypothetical protein [Luteimonas]|uniref:Ferric-dicitrate binding protein FerR (Iron transport regulator) n=1 Tax=Luteimonas terrae TaxID=1530191 RepID=A0ABU1XTP0_9GAMM|nr:MULTISPECIES: hypothetical protein [Luteimonas]MDR6991308.1 ferric-dicitrate binding protein FerR (iron transport regulator) [Luteimonas sp. 3794]MDR7192123.1 ferric-dicitrate binding protein FerR (iron transport regulator) [Luteimonas terrae]
MNRSHDPQDDAALRALYAQAQDSISPATTTRLHRARHAASQTPAPARRGWGMPLATGFAAVCAIAIGARMLIPGVDSPAQTATPVLAAADSAAHLDEGVDEALAGYDESPDFYRWLAANESTLLAVE